MSKGTTENDKNVSTKIVSATFENEIGSKEVSLQGDLKESLKERLSKIPLSFH